MKTAKSSWILGAAAAAGCLLAGAGAAFADVITLRADEWCPYNCAPTDAAPGFGVELAKEIFAKAGHSLDYKITAWPRAIDDCRKGNVAAVIGATKNETPDFVFPSESIGGADSTFLVRRGDPWRYAGPASLENRKLGVIQGYAYDGEVGAYVNDNLKNKARTDIVGGETGLDLNLKKLMASRIDVTVDAGPVLAYKIKQMGLTEKFDTAGSVDLNPVFVAFSPALPAAKGYAEIFDKGMAELRASGRLQAIYARYGVAAP